MNYCAIHKAFYEAALKAITLTGDAYKGLSWFAKNRPKQKGE